MAQNEEIKEDVALSWPDITADMKMSRLNKSYEISVMETCDLTLKEG